jgi:hypothetical protein
LIALAIGLGLSYVGAPAAEAQAKLGPVEKVLRIEHPTELRLLTGGATQEATFRVSVLDGAGPLALCPTPSISDVLTTGPPVADLRGRFKAAWRPLAGNRRARARTLVLTIDPAIRVPGTYEVILDFNLRERPAAPPASVKLTVPSAKLTGPAKLLVHRTVGSPQTIPDEDGALLVGETTRMTDAKTLRLTSLPFASGNRPITGTIALGGTVKDGAPAPAIPAGRHATIPYQLTGEFPLGLSAGTVRLEADEAAEALDVPVEVRFRLWTGYLAMAIAFGLFLSLVLKVWLAGRIKLNEARLAAGTLRAQVLRERSLFPDARFQQATTALLQTLETAAAGKKVKGIEDARLALDTAWRDARADLVSRRATLRADLDGWRKLTALSWDLPPSITPTLTLARASSAAAVALDEKGDVGLATSALNKAQTEAATALESKGYEWQEASRGLLDELVATSEGISAAILTRLKAKVDSWRGVASSIPGYPTGDPASVQQLLRHIDVEYGTARELLRHLKREVRHEFDGIAVRLNAAVPDEALVTAIDAQLAAFEALLEAAVDDPGTARTSLHEILRALQDAWATAFASASSSDAGAMRDKVKARDFRGAADLLLARNTRFATEDVGRDEAGRFGWPFRLPPQAQAGTSVAEASAPIGPFEALLVDAARDVWWAKGLQTLLLGAMFMLWALTTSLPVFDGTFHGLAVALVSAFGLDVGLDLLPKITGKLFA